MPSVATQNHTNQPGLFPQRGCGPNVVSPTKKPIASARIA